MHSPAGGGECLLDTDNKGTQAHVHTYAWVLPLGRRKTDMELPERGDCAALCRLTTLQKGARHQDIFYAPPDARRNQEWNTSIPT